MTWIVIALFISFLIGVGTCAALFGTGGKRSKVFEDIYFSIEDVDGIGVFYTKNGEYSCILRMENPVQKYSADIDSYYEFNTLIKNILLSLGEGYALHKQDIFVRKTFTMPEENKQRGFLSEAYFRLFSGRTYTSSQTYLIITQEVKKSSIFSYDSGKWRDFLVKIHKVHDQLTESKIKDVAFLDVREAREYADRYFAMNFRSKNYSMSSLNVSSNGIQMGDRQTKVFSLLDIDSVGLPASLRPYTNITVNNTLMPVDLMSEIDYIPDVDTIVYNQVIFLPNQKVERARLEKRKNHFSSLKTASNTAAADDIKNVLDVISRESKQLVYAHFNVVVSMEADKDMQKATNYLENIFSRFNIHLSKRAYNQLELFVATFPGNVFRLSPEYDRYLTLAEAALCLMYKECQIKGDDSPLKCYYTDRKGVPLAVDTTGKEGKIKYTNNSNFFVLGPSGSGKSFFMNTIVRQYYEQNTDIVLVDTGDSYEGLCSYFDGTYISYTKENPISMNPFKVTQTEYVENFGEKKNFLTSLIFLIYKGSSKPTKIESYIIERTIIEYYREYFSPFKGYTDSEKEELHHTLLISAKSSGEYDEYEERLQNLYGTGTYNINEDDLRRSERNSRIGEALQRLIEDPSTTEGEKVNARNQLQRLTPEVVEGKFLEKIEREIVKREQQRLSLRVTELSFNSYYEFARQRIPQIMREDNIQFPIHDFAAILKPFYKGGYLEYTLNNDMDSSLFDERFIVFEIDKIKDDPVLFPIIVLIIMDVFTQKMRIKKGRKCLVIEEAWKAIATPVMADYIKYLYKTARKHWAMVGVVTQEIQDITGSEIVKDAIISNSDVFMLLDQSKFKDKFDEIKATLALTDIDCKKIFTINRLDNKSDRLPFKEVFIKRGTESDVYGVEEPRECYMSYTTEKVEKEALKLYRRELNCSHQQAIEAFVRDWGHSGIQKSLDFSKKVMQEGRVLSD